MKIIAETTQRNLYFYELLFNPYKQYVGVEHYYLTCLRNVNTLVNNKDKSRYLKRANDTLFFGQLDFIPDKRYIKGKLFKVRNDVFPQFINMSNEDISDLEANAEQGILETTHFLIDYRNKSKAQLLLEYNHYGARITEFANYLAYLGRLTKTLKKVDVKILVRDRLESIATRVNKVSKFTVKIHRDNIARIQQTDEGMASALFHAQNYSKADYVELELKFDYKVKTDTPTIKDSLMKWVRKFITSPEEGEYFDRFVVEAEDEENNNKLESFDLLLDKESSRVTAEKKNNSRIIESDSFFPKIIIEYERKYI